jgi:murein DD-endopeptidase MepM/ murein hydrolase activator NlpD
MSRGWEIAIRDTVNGCYRRFRISRSLIFVVILLSVCLFSVCFYAGRGFYQYQSVLSENKSFQRQLEDRDAQLRLFAERMNSVRTDLASIRHLNQTVEHKLGRGEEPVLESGLGGPVKEVAGRNVMMRTYLNYESEFLESMWSEMEELELEAEYEFDRTILLARFLNTRSGFISAIPSLRPITGGYVSSPFGRRRDPFTGTIRMHAGIDFAHSSRVPVYATADGVVVMGARSPSYGNYVSVYHGYGISTLYAHLHRIDASVGDRVQRADQIGVLGSTGRSTHAHLHYEVRIEGRPVNPYYFLPGEHTE